MKVLSVLAGCIFLTLACGQGTPSDLDIAGGRPAEAGAFPAMVSLQAQWNGEYQHYCGGVLIAPQTVLSAAHCFFDYDEPLLAVVGEHDLSRRDPGEKRVMVSRIQVHPDYQSRTEENDLALLHLTKRVRVPVPDLNHRRLADTGGQQAVILGWGKTARLSGWPDRLMVGEVTLVDSAECQRRHRRDRVYETALCAGVVEEAVDSCEGDSGGPLLSHDGVLLGITSWGGRCGNRLRPGVYTRISSFAGWIRHRMR